MPESDPTPSHAPQPAVVEYLSLNPASSGKITTFQAIPSGRVAKVVISGVCGVWTNWSHGLDAAYCYDAPPGSAYYSLPKPARRLHIETNHGHFNPLPEAYNPSHLYEWHFIGRGERLLLWFNDSFHGDNTGVFNIQVSW